MFYFVSKENKMADSKLVILLCFFIFVFLSACSDREKQKTVDSNDNASKINVSASLLPLRILTWSGAETYLPRAGLPQDLELQNLKLFAEQHNRELINIKVEKFSDLIPMLLAGKGDLISANLTVTADRKKRVTFSDPFVQSREYLLMGKNSKSMDNAQALNGREVVIQQGKSYKITALGLQKAYPQLKIRYIKNHISNEIIYDRLAAGEYDLTLQDENLIETALGYRDDLKKSLQASRQNDIAWALSPKNKKLLTQINLFLKDQRLTVKGKSSIKNRWENIQQTKTIRFVLRNNLSSYYIWRGELLGFHYELAKRFAKEHKLRYEIIVAPDNVALLDYLVEDKADIALGFLTPTPQRTERGIIFSSPYHYASELIIAHTDIDPIDNESELSNRSLYLRPSSAYWQSAIELQKKVKNLSLNAVPEDKETESIIADIANKKYELTIADSHIVDLEMTFRDNIHSLMSLGEPKAQSWAVKKGNNQLLNASNDFIRKHYKGLFYNVIYNKYFRNPKRLDKHYKGYVSEKNSGILSPYDEIVKKYALQYDFDWRLLIAQMHQESRFDPNATSMAGAQGLFQVMPRTAKELGIDDVHIPEQGIKAGIHYMDWVRQRMRVSEVDENELIWFTLASYNAGAGHVRDAMRLAKQKGWKSNIWFNNVEKAMLLLAKPKYASKARYGYVRGEEPVTYIRAIKRRFDTYQSRFN